MKETREIKIIGVTIDNVEKAGLFCIKDKKSPGYKAKLAWFRSRINEGLGIRIAMNPEGKQVGFIEFIPSERAWRPIKATNYMFIQCIGLFAKEAREKGTGSLLLTVCEQEARKQGKSGICAMSSNGVWMANKSLFEKNGFSVADKLERFELMAKPFDKNAGKPEFIDWTQKRSLWKGWNLVYSDQCPWHEKSVTDLQQCAAEYGIMLKTKKLGTPSEAQDAPSGFGTFSLILDGRLLADHYISRTRFESIMKKEKR